MGFWGWFAYCGWASTLAIAWSLRRDVRRWRELARDAMEAAEKAVDYLRKLEMAEHS